MRSTVARILTLVGAAILLSSAMAARADDAPEVPPKTGKSETIKLFNGQNLEGWQGEKKFWSVADGVIVGKNLHPVKVSTYLLTERKFTDFRLLATVKLVRSEMHSGIALWGRVAPERGRNAAALRHGLRRDRDRAPRALRHAHTGVATWLRARRDRRRGDREPRQPP